jgi:aryl-alcohol dehydrogenase-like predicted oxidoreductase
MEQRFLGRTGVRISAVVAGTMAFGGDADEATAAQIFARCRDAGVNTFDCADVYAGGRSEEVLGRLVAGCRNEIVLCTKAYFPTGEGPNDRGSSRYHLVRAAEASLRRLDTDRIDVFYLHRFDDATPLEETLRGVEMLVTQGKILYPAVSNFAAWQASRALGIAERHGWAPIVCTQPMYNLVKRQAEVEIMPMAQAEGLGVLTYSPLGGGLLSGKYGRDRRPDTGRLIDNAMYRVRYGDASVYDVAERFAAIAAREGLHPATLAVAWVRSHPAVTAPLVGVRNLEQLEPCLAGGELTLRPELRDELSALSPAPAPATDRNEETSSHNYGSR